MEPIYIYIYIYVGLHCGNISPMLRYDQVDKKLACFSSIYKQSHEKGKWVLKNLSFLHFFLSYNKSFNIK